jgi:hypothetical protein
MKFSALVKSTIGFLVIILWGITAQAQPISPPPGLAIAQDAQAIYSDALLDTPGVVGHGITTDENGQAVIVVFIARPLVPGIPQFVTQVPVNTLFTGRFYALAPPLCGGPPSGRPPECFESPEPEPGVDPTARFDIPIPIGVSTGHPDITAGTIGARVVDPGGKVFALSNNHVFANSNDTSSGEVIYQPGPFDGGGPDDDFATLHSYVPIVFDGSDNFMDAAIAEPYLDHLGNATPSDGYGTPGTVTAAPFLGQSVQKYGRTTGLTQGSVAAINFIGNVCYEGSPICTKLARFVNQIVITDGSFSAGGDSGSLIVTTGDNSPVGLLFAGSSSYTIATPIDVVLSTFNVEIDGQNPPPDSGVILLNTNGYKVRGLQKADLSWNGASGEVDVYRDGEPLVYNISVSPYTDDIDNKGGGSYVYRVCEAGTSECSNESTVVF